MLIPSMVMNCAVQSAKSVRFHSSSLRKFPSGPSSARMAGLAAAPAHAGHGQMRRR